MQDLWTLRPNWRGTYSVTYAFSTEIFTSRSGKEQRRANRQSPRKSIEFMLTAYGDRYRAMANLFKAKQGATLIKVPEVTEGTQLTAVATAGDDTLHLTDVLPWAMAGQRVALVYEDEIDVQIIQGVGGNIVTLEDEITSDWKLGTKLCPIVMGRLNANTSLSEILPGTIEGTIHFDVDPGSEMVQELLEPSLVWGGREVFIGANYKNASAITYNHDVSVVDNDIGRVTVLQPIPFAYQTKQVDCVAFTPAQARELRDFFLRMKGRRGEFYAPSDRPDIILAQAADGDVLTVDGDDLFAAYADDTVNAALSFYMADGTRFFRRVDGLSVDSGQTKIQLQGDLPYEITAESVIAISWLPLQRHATDEITIVWNTAGVATVRFNFQSIEALSVET